jgi:phosphoglucomutase
MIHERAGLFAAPADLVDVAHLVSAYYSVEPDADDIAQRVVFLLVSGFQ